MTGRILELDDGIVYIYAKEFEYEQNKYAVLIEKDSPFKNKIVLVSNDEEGTFFEEVEDDLKEKFCSLFLTKILEGE